MASKPGSLSPIDIYMSLLKTYSGRDKVLRTLGYTAILVSGSFKGKIKKDLETLALHFGATRTVLRLLDDLPMLLITKASIFAQVHRYFSFGINVLISHSSDTCEGIKEFSARIWVFGRCFAIKKMTAQTQCVWLIRR